MGATGKLNMREKTIQGVIGETLSGGPEVVEQLTPEWCQLCDSPSNQLPFCRPEWVAAYVRKQKDARVLLFTVRLSGKLCGLLPLIPKTARKSFFPVRVLRGPSEYLLWPSDVLISSESERQVVARELWRLTRQHRGWDVIELPNVPKGGIAEDLLKLAETEGFRTYRWEYMHSPYLALSEHHGAQDPLQIARSSKLRRNLRVTLRKIESEGGVRTHHFETADPQILHALYEHEACGWKGEAGSAILSSERDQVFWNTIASVAEQNRYLSMCALEFQGRIVAVGVGFNYKQKQFGMKLGWDGQLRSYSLGHLLVWAMLSDCCRRGISEFHLMGLRSDWKEQWTRTTQPYSMCYIFRKGLYGSAVRTAELRSIAWRKKTFASRQEYLEH